MERTETAADLAAEFARDDAEARHALRRWATSPLFPGLDSELADGAVPDHPLFPVVWP